MVTLANEAVPLSDKALERVVTHQLLDRHVPALRSVIVRADSGTITLRGTVTSFYQKQLCIQACRTVPGVTALIDEVEVASIL